MEENPDRENIMKVWKYYTNWRCHHCYRKIYENHQSPKTNSCWKKKNMCKCCAWFQRVYNKEIKTILKEIVDKAKKWGVKYGSWRNSRIIKHHTRGINRRLVLLNKGQSRRKRCRKSSDRNKINISQSCRTVPII